MQGLKPDIVQMLATELAIDALDVAFLHRATWLKQDVANAMSLRPGHEGPAGEFRSVVSAHRLWIPAKQRGTLRAYP